MRRSAAPSGDAESVVFSAAVRQIARIGREALAADEDRARLADRVAILDAAVADEEIDLGLRLEVGDAVADDHGGPAAGRDEAARDLGLAAAARERARGVEAGVAAGGVEAHVDAVKPVGHDPELLRERHQRRPEAAAHDVDDLAEACSAANDRRRVLGGLRDVARRHALEIGARSGRTSSSRRR